MMAGRQVSLEDKQVHRLSTTKSVQVATDQRSSMSQESSQSFPVDPMIDHQHHQLRANGRSTMESRQDTTWEDDQVRRLHQSGNICQVFGSQSMLSQELSQSSSIHAAGNDASLLDAASIVQPMTEEQSNLSSMINTKSSPLKRSVSSLTTPPMRKSSHHTSSTSIEQGSLELIKRIVQDSELKTKLLVSMTVQTRSTRARRTTPKPGTVAVDFEWSEYPQLEQVLHTHKSKYYRSSMTDRHSASHSKLLDSLYEAVLAKAKAWGWDLSAIGSKKLRNRIRTYYKTQLQNSKARLQTILSDPSSPSSLRKLTEYGSIIDECAKK